MLLEVKQSMTNLKRPPSDSRGDKVWNEAVDKTLDLVREWAEEKILPNMNEHRNEGYNQALDDLTNYLNSLKK